MTPHEEWHLETRHIGRRVLVYNQLDSTNTRAAQFAEDGGNHGLVVVAEEQSAGRGQHGRTWQAPSGRAVLMSVLLFPPPALRRPVLLTAWAAVSVCETIRQATGIQAKIKWPNDVLLRGKKACGILIESKTRNLKPEEPRTKDQEPNSKDEEPRTKSQEAKSENRESSEHLEFGSWNLDIPTVVGIGLNVNQTAEDFENARLPEAGSMSLFTSQVLDCPTVTRLLIERLDEEYDRMVQGDLAGLESCWKWHLGLLGKQVAVDCPDGRHWGRLRELNLDEVHLERDGIGTTRFVPEMIQHIELA
jgi:BirA family biotin operon repressor/biotin-[acetyl-CoA-carboxylase] ligase